MAEITEHAPGKFCWADLACIDPDQAKKAYGDLFQWEFQDIPVGEGMVYSMALVRGKQVAGLYRMDQAEQEKGWPPRWQTYVAVADADATAGRVVELGGKVISAPFDVPDAGRMAVIQDPAGALLSLWQPRRHTGAQLVEEPGSICWNELLTRDIDRAGSFYIKLFGWQASQMDTGTGPYTIFKLGDKPEAGMMSMPAECGPEVPSNWMIYLMVENCDASVAKAERFGIRVIKGATDIPSVGRFAVMQDREGASFALFQQIGS